jgi:hypothetical protein
MRSVIFEIKTEMTINRSVIVTISCLLPIAAAFSRIPHERQKRECDAYEGSTLNLEGFSAFVKEMLDKNAAGVVSAEGTRYVSSFDSLYHFIKQHHPDLVSGKDSANPFRGILCEGDFEFERGPFPGPDFAILKTRKFVGPIFRGQNVRSELSADGTVHENVVVK